MDDELYRTTRIEAAKAGKSMSRFLADAARQKIEIDNGMPKNARRNLELEAIERFLSGPPLNIAENGRMPSARERNSRGWQRDIR